VLSASRLTASVLGVYAGLLAVEHGVFEFLQGDPVPSGAMINAIGPPCEAATVWHACLPAMTVIPGLRITGVVAIVMGLVVAIWSAVFIQRQRGGLILMGLALAMLPVGAGFVAPFTGLIAGAAGTRIGAPPDWWWARLSARAVRPLAALWPWPLVLFMAWFPGGWVLGHLVPSLILRLGLLLFVAFDLVLPLVVVVSALAKEGVLADAVSSED